MNAKHIFVVPIAVGALAVGIAACGGSSGSPGIAATPPQQASSSHQPSQQPAQPKGGTISAGTISLAKFNQIQTGMTYEQVKQLAGGDGKLQNQSEAGGMSMRMYTWDGDKPVSWVNVQFTNGQVTSKAQAG